jgi:chemotaxis protein CheX
VNSDASTIELPTANDFASIIEQVWGSFLDGDIVEEPVPASGAATPLQTDGRVVGWVSISGDWNGHLLVTASPAGARAIAAGLFQLEADEIGTEDIADAIGEIANVVGGTVKGMIGATASLSLPQVVLGATAVISLSADERATVRLLWKEELIEVSLWEGRTQPKTGGLT